MRKHHEHGGKADPASRFFRYPCFVVEAGEELSIFAHSAIIDLCDLCFHAADIHSAFHPGGDEQLAGSIFDRIWDRGSYDTRNTVLNRVNPDFEGAAKLLYRIQPEA